MSDTEANDVARPCDALGTNTFVFVQHDEPPIAGPTIPRELAELVHA